MLNESNNVVHLQGTIMEDGKLSHITHGEGFYEFKLQVNRKSGTVDVIPVLISERLIEKPLKKGDIISIDGQMRSYNQRINGESEEFKTKLMLNVFVLNFCMIASERLMNPNTIKLKGYICKKPMLRITPFKKEVSDVLLAVNRSYNKSDYIPCIAWGRNAKYVSKLNVGDEIEIVGRIQSRDYMKQLSPNEAEKRVAYEVSIMTLEKIDNTNLDKTDEMEEIKKEEGTPLTMSVEQQKVTDEEEEPVNIIIDTPTEEGENNE